MKYEMYKNETIYNAKTTTDINLAVTKSTVIYTKVTFYNTETTVLIIQKDKVPLFFCLGTRATTGGHWPRKRPPAQLLIFIQHLWPPFICPGPPLSSLGGKWSSILLALQLHLVTSS